MIEIDVSSYFEDDIARLQHESVHAMIEVIIRDAMIHGYEPEDIAASLLSAIGEHIDMILGRLYLELTSPVLH